MNKSRSLRPRHLTKQTGNPSIAFYLGGVGIALWALIVALKPDVGFLAPLPWMAFFWALQISIGLVVLQLVLFLITRLKTVCRWPLWIVVVVSGVVGSIFLSPLYWLIGEGLMEQVLGFATQSNGAANSKSTLTFELPALVHEFSDIVGPVTAAWVLISWPRLQRLVPPLMSGSPAAEIESVSTASLASIKNGALTPSWRAALPSQLGNELIAVGSELQYLRVWTTRGSALILGSLQEVEESEGLTGVRVHRSWWVNAQHVVRVRNKSDGAACELSNGLEVPVSRRRKADVIVRFGNSARYHPTSIEPA